MTIRGKKNWHGNESGVALILVLLAILVLTTLTAAMVYTARTETLASYNYRIGTQAEYAARAGIQKALNFFKSASYAPVPSATASTTYDVSPYGYIANTIPLFFANQSLVRCLTAASGCSSLIESPVKLGTSGSGSNYPGSAITGGVDVVANWLAATQNQSLSDSMGGTGSFSVISASLLDYHTVNNGYYGSYVSPGCTDILASSGICRQPYEAWEVTAVGTWNSNLGAGSNISPTATVTAIVSPVYMSYSGNALYGMCNVTLSGNVCTDAYNSGSGVYSGSATSCATATSGSSNANATGGGIGANGGITINGGAATVGGSATVANDVLPPDPTSCETGFTGSSSTVNGTVGTGPQLTPPTMPNMTTWGYNPPTASPVPGAAISVTPGSGSGVSTKVANVYLSGQGGTVPPGTALPGIWPPPLPPGVSLASACPGGYSGYVERFSVRYSASLGTNVYSNYVCNWLSGSGTSSSPYLVGDVTANSSNPGTINIISPSGALTSPVYAAMNSITAATNGAIYISNQAPPEPLVTSYNPVPTLPTTNSNASPLILDVAGNLDLEGTTDMNYNPANPGTPSPNYLRMFVEGSQVTLKGQASLSAVITAPYSNVDLGGSGSTGTFFGSIMGDTINDHGNYPVHYDMASKMDSGSLFTSRIINVTRPQM